MYDITRVMGRQKLFINNMYVIIYIKHNTHTILTPFTPTLLCKVNPSSSREETPKNTPTRPKCIYFRLSI